MTNLASLSLQCASEAVKVAWAIRRFCKDYKNVPEDVQGLQQQSTAWEVLAKQCDHILQPRHAFPASSEIAYIRHTALAKQRELCRKYLTQLSDDLKLSPEKARQHNWKRVVIAFKKKELQDCMRKLRECYDLLCTATLIESSELQGQGLESLQWGVEQLRLGQDQHLASDELKQVLEWISPDTQLGINTHHIHDYKVGTLNALFDDNDYLDWQNGTSNEATIVAPDILWGHGPPGAGKSTFVSAVVQNLQTLYGEEAIIVYAYCSYERTETQSPRNILAYMTRMAVEQLGRCPDYVLEVWKKQRGTSDPSPSVLNSLLCQLLQERRKAFIVVDALDELTFSESKSIAKRLRPDALLKEINGILKCVNQAIPDNCSRCKALLTSREGSSQNNVKDVKELRIEATVEDIRYLLAGSVNRGFDEAVANKIHHDDPLRTRIIEEIAQNAHGVFLLAPLQLEFLRRCGNVRDLKTALSNLPRDLRDSHHRSMARIQNQPKEVYKKAMSLLSLVYYSKYPLSVRAIQQALAVRDNDKDFDEDGIDGQETLINITAGLLTVRDRKLGFAHPTVREFLSTSGSDASEVDQMEELPSDDWFTPNDLGHGFLANQSLNFLVLDDFREALDPQRRSERNRNYPFLNYAVNHIGYHAGRATESEYERYHLTRRCYDLLEKGAMHQGVLQEFAARMWTSTITAQRTSQLELPKPHLAVLCNFVEQAKSLITPTNVNEPATRKDETVLHIASRCKSRVMVEMLLEKRADLNLVNYSGKTALDMILVEPLQRLPAIPQSGSMLKGANLQEKRNTDDMNQTRTGIEKVVGTLISFLSYADARKLSTSPLMFMINQLAAEGVTQLFSQIIEQKIRFSMSEEVEELVMLFIEAGIDIDSRHMSRETPLQLVTLYELPRLVQCLLNKGANPFIAWHCTLTPLQIAQGRNNPELVDVIMKKEKELDAMEASMSDEESKQKIPGRAQANHLSRLSQEQLPERDEKMHGITYSQLDNLLKDLRVNKKQAPKGASQDQQANPTDRELSSVAGGEHNHDRGSCSNDTTTKVMQQNKKSESTLPKLNATVSDGVIRIGIEWLEERDDETITPNSGPDDTLSTLVASGSDEESREPVATEDAREKMLTATSATPNREHDDTTDVGRETLETKLLAQPGERLATTEDRQT